MPEHKATLVTNSLQALVDDYIANHTQQTHEAYLSKLKNITDYICGVPNDREAPGGAPYKFDTHQWHLRFPSRSIVVDNMAVKLKDIDNEDFADFEALYDYVDRRKEKYFSDTCVYDFALRYGWNRTSRISPKDFVYIHSKPLESAKKLKDLGYIPEVGHFLPLSNYSALLGPGMNAMDVEHFLCIYHDQIDKM